MLNIQTIDNALAFLERSSLTGKEVPAFVEVMNALHAQRVAINEAAASNKEAADPTVIEKL